jgi:hypothetical protein
MNIRIALLVILYFVSSLFFDCKTQTSDNFVKFTIDSPTRTGTAINKFIAGDYKFPLKSVCVMRGSNDGMEAEFLEREGKDSTIALKFILPSSSTFKVFASGKGYTVKIPELPCTVTNEDFKGIKSVRAHSDVLAFINIERNIRVASDQSRVESIYFEIFSINIKTLNFDKEKINFEGTFTAEMSEKQKTYQDADYKISGDFRISNSGVSIMMVDD